MAKKAKYGCTRKTYCPAMGKTIDDRRVRVHMIYDSTKNAMVKKMVCVHAGEYQKSGIVLNLCPFCGKKLGVMPYKEVFN